MIYSYIALLFKNTATFLLYYYTALMIKSSDKDTLKKFGENLRKLRDSRKLSLRDVAINCNIDNGQISKIEQGQVNITLITLLELAKGLNVRPGYLLLFAGD